MIKAELERVWKKKSYLCMFAIAMALQIFVLWYSCFYQENERPLSEYKKINTALSDMTEEEKGAYLSQKKQESNSEVVSQVYREYLEVNGYAAYIEGVVRKQDKLNQISIFSQEEGDSFSEKNIVKSAKDHEGMEEQNLRFFCIGGHRKNIFVWSVGYFSVSVIRIFCHTSCMGRKRNCALDDYKGCGKRENPSYCRKNRRTFPACCNSCSRAITHKLCLVRRLHRIYRFNGSHPVDCAVYAE